MGASDGSRRATQPAQRHPTAPSDVNQRSQHGAIERLPSLGARLETPTTRTHRKERKIYI
eukprot:812950-Prorocentrum_minimum.AAC.1